MEYKQLGKTGKAVSAIGLGCEWLDRKPYEQVKETIDAALEVGVNIFDVFMPGREVRENIAKALGDRRGKVMIQGHIGATDVNQKFDISRDMPNVKKYFEDLLRIFGGYIDFGMLFFIDSQKDFDAIFNTDFVKYAEHLKKQGDIGHIGFSSHNPAMAIEAINTGVPEMFLFSVNPAFDMIPSEKYIFDHFEVDTGFGSDSANTLFRGIDPKRAELYKLCEQKQIGITAMKPFAAGKLISKEHTPYNKPLTIPQCIHYALSRPAVASVMPGCSTRAQVYELMEYFQASESERDFSEIINSVRSDFKGACVYCSHCQPCPMDIDIAAVMKYLDIARLDLENIPPSIRSHYLSLDMSGADCNSCGRCESRCPFGVPIIDNMSEATRIFTGTE